MDILVFLQAHLKGHNPAASSSGKRGLFFEYLATLGVHLYSLLGIEKFLWVTTEKCPVDGDLLALVVTPLTDLSVLKVT